MHKDTAILVENLSKEYQINIIDIKTFKRDLISFFKLEKFFDTTEEDKKFSVSFERYKF